MKPGVQDAYLNGLHRQPPETGPRLNKPLSFRMVSCILPGMEEPVPRSPKKIRLTKSEVYAMRLSSPRKRKLAFGLVGLLIAAALGNVLWHFQEFWLPYWFPGTNQSAPAASPENAGQLAAPAGQPATATAPVPVHMEAKLDFLTAATWENSQFQQGVRLFNRALDLYRQTERTHVNAAPPQIETDALQADRIFEALRSSAPAHIPLDGYVARCQQLAMAARQLGRPVAPAAAPASNPHLPPATARAEVPPYRPGEPWQHPDYLQGAKLFNQALEQYKQFLADKSHTELLAPIEDAAFQAAKKFEALKDQAPEGVPLGDHITQCYKLISDCRRQDLEGGESESNGGKPFERGTAGPSRRPALPAYQPAPAP